MRDELAKENPLIALLFDEDGNNVLDDQHPAFAERVKYLEAIANELD